MGMEAQMVSSSIGNLEAGQQVPLLVQFTGRTGKTHLWRRVGEICRVGDVVQVVYDAGAEHVRPVWEACVHPHPAQGTAIGDVRFGVFCSRRGVQVLATGRLTPRLHIEARIIYHQHKPTP